MTRIIVRIAHPSWILAALLTAITSCPGVTADDLLTASEIGKSVFLDTSLSNPSGQGCVSCHQPNAAFADPRPVSPGAVADRKGIRNAPSLMYVALIPPFAYEDVFTKEGDEIYAYEGGLFHDGRANDLFEQVQQPFFDANEMNLQDEAQLTARLRKAEYADALRTWVGEKVWKDDQTLAYHVYRSLVEFLKDPMFRPFDSRIDHFLAGNASALSTAEKRGLDVFREQGKCADCHFLEPTNWQKPLLSDFGYDNLGVPSRGKKDPGLGGHTKNAEQLGMFRAPSLRNVALTGPYMHNGSIASLREVLEFYNKRDVEPKRWGTTDYPETVNHDDMGNLKMSEEQIDDLLALMRAFTDRSLLTMKNQKLSFPAVRAGTRSTKQLRLYFPDWTHRKHTAFPGKPDLQD